MSGLQVVGTNNAYQTVRYNKSRPLHESHGRDNETLAEPSVLRPGQRTKVKLDLLHSGGREVVLNDLRLINIIGFQDNNTYAISAEVGPYFFE